MALETEQLVKRAVRRYKALCWWADTDDLAQEAQLVILEARRTFKPEVGVPFEGYAWRAVMLTLRNYLWRCSAPVSASNHALCELGGLHRAALTDALLDGAAVDAEEQMARLQSIANTRTQVCAIMDATPDGGLAEEVLLNQQVPRDVALQKSVPVAKVYRAVQRAVRAIETDAQLHDIWKEW